MSHLSNLFLEKIRLSELSDGKRQQILDLLSSAPSKDLSFEETESGEVLVTYKVSINQSLKDISSNVRSTNVNVPERTPLRQYAMKKQTESVLDRANEFNQKGKSKKRRIRSKYIRGKLWVLKFIQEIYSARFQLFSTEIASPEGKLESFSSFVFSFIQSKFGLKSLVKQATRELLESVKLYSKKDPIIELFGLFLTTFVSTREVMFFLHARETVIKVIMSKERPQSTTRKTHFEILITKERIRHLTNKILAKQPRNLKRICFNRLKEYKFHYGKPARSKKPGYFISINHYLAIMLEEYRKVASRYYSILPEDVPYYHRIRDRSVLKYIQLRPFQKHQRGGHPRPSQMKENLVGGRTKRKRGSRVPKSSQFVNEEQLREYIDQENYNITLDTSSTMSSATDFYSRKGGDGQIPILDRHDGALLGLMPTGGGESRTSAVSESAATSSVTPSSSFNTSVGGSSTTDFLRMDAGKPKMKSFNQILTQASSSANRKSEEDEDGVDLRLPTFDDELIKQEDLFTKIMNEDDSDEESDEVEIADEDEEDEEEEDEEEEPKPLIRIGSGLGLSVNTASGRKKKKSYGEDRTDVLEGVEKLVGDIFKFDEDDEQIHPTRRMGRRSEEKEEEEEESDSEDDESESDGIDEDEIDDGSLEEIGGGKKQQRMMTSLLDDPKLMKKLEEIQSIDDIDMSVFEAREQQQKKIQRDKEKEQLKKNRMRRLQNNYNDFFPNNKDDRGGGDEANKPPKRIQILPNIYRMMLSSDEEDMKLASFHHLEEEENELDLHRRRQREEAGVDDQFENIKDLVSHRLDRTEEPDVIIDDDEEDSEDSEEEEDRKRGKRKKRRSVLDELNMNSLVFNKFAEPLD